MSYKNLVAQAVATRAEVFKRFRDWICARNGSYDYTATGLGWTLHDSSYATDQNTLTSGDYFVIKSIGESGKEGLYFKVIYSATSGQIQIQRYQYWNNSTHAGVNGQTAVNNWQVSESASGSLYIYGDLDTVFVCCLFTGTYYGCIFGMVNDPVYDKTVATSSDAVSAGSNVVVAVDSVPSSWAVGGKVVIRDNANIERVTISNIASLNVTFTSIVASYSAGCKLSKDYPVVCQGSSNIGASFYATFGHDNTKNAATSSVAPTVPGADGDPDPLDGEWLVSALEIGDTTYGHFGRFTNIMIGTTSFTHLGVYTTAAGVNYRTFNSIYSSVVILVKEV